MITIDTAIGQVCDLPHHEHVMIMFAAQVVVQFALGLVNYFGFTANPKVKSSTLFEFLINVCKAILSRKSK